MSSTSNSQSVDREAQDSSVRSVKLNPDTDTFSVSGRQQRKARSIARQICSTKQGRQQTAALLIQALSVFGGHIKGFSPAQ